MTEQRRQPDAMIAAADRLEAALIAILPGHTAEAHDLRLALADLLAVTIERASAMAASAVLQFIGTQAEHGKKIDQIIENQADKRIILHDINARLTTLERDE